MSTISVKSLSKRYPGSTHYALNKVSFSLEQGVFGLLGPNGAGKTTLLRILATLISPTSGDVWIDGYDLRKEPSLVRTLIGYLPQEYSLYPNLSAKEFLEYMGLLSNVPDLRNRIERILDEVGLLSYKHSRIKTFSGGMKQRLGIAQALIHNPPILLVDEPTAGLDPAERVRFRNMLSGIGERRTVLLSTHIVDDIAVISKQVIILNKGKVLFSGDTTTLISMAHGKVWEVCTSPIDWETFVKKSSCFPVSFQQHESGCTNIRFLMFDDSMIPDGAKQVSPTIEDAYLLLTSTGVESDESH